MAKQHKRPQRIDTSAGRQSLTDNPFAALAPGGAPAPEPEPATTPKAGPDTPPPSFRVARTRKGGMPVFLEKRPNGKNVTVVRNISGDLDAALTALKKLCGAGGTARDDTIEIQGDHRERVEAFLRQHAAKG